MKKYLLASSLSVGSLIASIVIFCGFIIEASFLLIVGIVNKLFVNGLKLFYNKPKLQPSYVKAR